MSYNIQFVVEDDGIVTVDTDSSYSKTAPRGRFFVSGHVVPDGESAGFEYVDIATPDGLKATAGRKVNHV